MKPFYCLLLRCEQPSAAPKRYILLRKLRPNCLETLDARFPISWHGEQVALVYLPVVGELRRGPETVLLSFNLAM